VLIAQHSPQAIAVSGLECDLIVPPLLMCMADSDVSVPDGWSLQSSSAFSDSWSCSESPCSQRKPYLHDEDFLSDVASVCLTETSTLLDENEWPFVHVRDCHSLYRQWPVTENFVAEIKSHVSVSRGLLYNSHDDWAMLAVGPTELVKPGSQFFDSSVEMSDEKRKEAVLHASTDKSCVGTVKDTTTLQTVGVSACTPGGIQVDDRSCHQLYPVDLRCDMSARQHIVESGHKVGHETVMCKCKVEPCCATTWSTNEDFCQSRLEDSQRELVCFADSASGCEKCHGICTRSADRDPAVQSCHQLTTTAPADASCSAVVKSKRVGVVRYETCSIDKRLLVKLQDSGRSCSAEELHDGEHSWHPVNNSSLQSSQTMKSLSNSSSGTYVFSSRDCEAEKNICKQLEICARNNYVDGHRMSASCDNVADLNLAWKLEISGRQGDVVGRVTESCPRSRYWTDEYRGSLDSTQSDWERLSSRNLSTQARLVMSRDDIGAEMVSGSVSNPVLTGVSKPAFESVVTAASVVDSQPLAVDSELDLKSVITGHDHTSHVTDLCDKVLPEQTIDVTGNEAVQVVSESGISNGKEFVQSVNCADRISQPLMEDHKILTSAPSSCQSINISSLSLDLFESLADSVSGPSVEESINHCHKVDQQRAASNMVNSKLNQLVLTNSRLLEWLS